MIAIQHRRTALGRIEQKYPDAVILDLTSHGVQPWIRFSPFYPHGDIPVPFSPGQISASIEGIWQGLKVFERADIDPSRFTVTSMKRLKRSARTYGRVLGHRQGIEGSVLLDYAEARRLIYLPSYSWVLANHLQEELKQLKEQAEKQMVILLDYETNCDLNDLSHPLSHAGLVKRYLEEQWPAEDLPPTQ